MNGRTAKLLRRYALVLGYDPRGYRALKRYWATGMDHKRRAKERRRVVAMLRAHGLMV